VQLLLFECCAIAQAVSRLHFTTKNRFRPHPSPYEICGGEWQWGRFYSAYLPSQDHYPFFLILFKVHFSIDSLSPDCSRFCFVQADAL